MAIPHHTRFIRFHQWQHATETVTNSSELKRGGSLLPDHEVYLLSVRCIAQRFPRHGLAVVPVPVPRVRPVERNKEENGVCGGVASGFVPFVPLSCYINFTSSRRRQREDSIHLIIRTSRASVLARKT